MRWLSSSMMLWAFVVVVAFFLGPRVGVIIGTVVGFGLLFGIFNAVQEILLAKGYVARRVGTPFDALLALAVIVLVIKHVVLLIDRHPDAWSTGLDYWLLVMLVGLLLLGRVLGLLRNVQKQLDEKSV